MSHLLLFIGLRNSGIEKDGMIWGRGAVDMKNMVAMILTVMRTMAREGRKPQRKIIFSPFLQLCSD